MSKTCSALAAAATVFFLLATSAAQAQTVNRAWVSGHGTDAAGCGAPTQPCRSLQYVHDNIVASGGEIDILDPAGYGAISIGKPISIVNDGIGTAGVQASFDQNAITINTPGAGDAVYLRGLTIEGLGLANSGIAYNSAGTLEVIDCSIRNFGNRGMNIAPNGALSLLVSNTYVLDNAQGGVLFNGSAMIIASVNGVTVNDNLGAGFNISGRGLVEVQISNSHIDNNSTTGIGLGGFSPTQTANLVLIDTTINQTPTGLSLFGDANVWLSHVIAAAAPGFTNTAGIALSGSNNVVRSDGTSHLNSGSLSLWGFQ